MPDPTAHAADMKSPAVIKPNEMPSFWWLNPWGYAINLKRALHAVHLLGETTADAYEAAKTVIKQKEEWADYRGKQHNDFQREVEVTLEAALSPDGYNDTIDLVHLAADEIKRLKASLSVMTEDRDAYIAKVEAHRLRADSISESSGQLIASRDAQIDELYKRIKALEAPIWNIKTDGKKYGDLRDGYAAYAGMMLGHMHSPNQKPKAKPKRKPAKKKVNLRTASVDDLVKAMSKKPAKKKGGRK